MNRIIFVIVIFTSILFGQNIKVKYKTLQLSYMTTDRAGGILKSLGYAVVDFEKKGVGAFKKFESVEPDAVLEILQSVSDLYCNESSQKLKYFSNVLNNQELLKQLNEEIQEEKEQFEKANIKYKLQSIYWPL